MKLYDVYQTPDSWTLVMQYCKGGDLFTYFENRKFKMSEAHVKRIVYELLQGLKYL